MFFTQWSGAGALQIPTGRDSWTSSSKLKHWEQGTRLFLWFYKDKATVSRLVWISLNSFQTENLRSIINFILITSSTFFKWSKSVCKMQAVRQCSVCASRAAGGLFTDVSLLWTNKGALRRGAACIRFLRYVMNSQCHIVCSWNIA